MQALTVVIQNQTDRIEELEKHNDALRKRNEALFVELQLRICFDVVEVAEYRYSEEFKETLKEFNKSIRSLYADELKQLHEILCKKVHGLLTHVKNTSSCARDEQGRCICTQYRIN